MAALRRSRYGLLIGTLAFLVFYAGFAAACFWMETSARELFEVPTKADIEATEDRTARIRLEGARRRALDDMWAWRPYAIYRIGLNTVALVGTVSLTILGCIAVWRGVRRNSVLKDVTIFVGMLLVLIGSLLLFDLPSLLAERHYDAGRTAVVAGE